MKLSGKTGTKPSSTIKTFMTIALNGKTHETQEGINITTLLDSLNLSGKPVVIEHNKVAIFPRDYTHISLKENDQLEIINIAAGG